MSSLNQAFIKAYGREGAGTAAADSATPPVAPQSQVQVLENWYTADTWYRVETPAAPAVVPAPHLHFPAAYQSPRAEELARMAQADEVRQDPSDLPELVIEEECGVVPGDEVETAPIAITPRIETPPVASPPPAPRAAQAPVATPAPAIDLSALYASVQVSTGWQSMPEVVPTATIEPPPVIAPAIQPAVTPEKPQAPAPIPAATLSETAAAKSAPPPALTTATPPAALASKPRIDAASSPPVPKPHSPFSAEAVAAPAPAQPASPVVTAPTNPVAAMPLPAAPVAEAAPLGIMQPAWEVDRFQWPDHCRQLLSAENEYLSDVGGRLASAAKDGLSILAITSTRRGEGRTTLALCLARAAADAGVKVALVDADIDNAQLVNELGVEAACGWQEVVLGKQPLSEAAIVSLEDKFAFFPWTSSEGLKSLNDPRATRVLREIANSYSLVILDLGPVPGRETRMFEDGENCPVDAAILVRDVRWTSAVEAQRVAEHLTAAGVESVGVAENFGPRAQQAA